METKKKKKVMKVKIKLVVFVCCFLLAFTPAKAATNAIALPIFGLFKAAVKKVIKAIDLRIQRLQNKTIWLQQAQKKIENTLSQLKLHEISQWTERQLNLYRDYYEELLKVKAIISYYQRIRDIANKQTKLVQQYTKMWNLMQKDAYFTAKELAYMHSVYAGILEESLQHIDQLFTVIESFTVQMSDAERLAIINRVSDAIDQNYQDLNLFNQQNILLSLQRAKGQHDVQRLKEFYGLEH